MRVVWVSTIRWLPWSRLIRLRLRAGLVRLQASLVLSRLWLRAWLGRSSLRLCPRLSLSRLGLWARIRLRVEVALLGGSLTRVILGLRSWVTLWLLRAPIALLSLWAGVRTVIRHSWRSWRVEPRCRAWVLALLYRHNSDHNSDYGSYSHNP